MGRPRNHHFEEAASAVRDEVDILLSIATVREFHRPRRFALLARLIDAYRHHHRQAGIPGPRLLFRGGLSDTWPPLR